MAHSTSFLTFSFIQTSEYLSCLEKNLEVKTGFYECFVSFFAEVASNMYPISIPKSICHFLLRNFLFSMLQNCATKLLHIWTVGFSNFWSQKRLPVVLHFWSRLQHDLLQWHVGNWPELLIQLQLQLPIQWVQLWFLCDFQKAYCRWIVDTNFLLFLLLWYVFLHQFPNWSKRLRLLDF